MGVIIKCLFLSFVLGTGCKLFFETMLLRRTWEHQWIEKTLIPAFVLGFMVISFTEIPPYIFQPIRVIAVICVIVQIYFQVKIRQNLALSVLFCAFYWINNTLLLACFYVLPSRYMQFYEAQEVISDVIFFLLILFIHHKYRGKMSALCDTKWARFGYFPVFSMVVIMAMTLVLWNGEGIARNAVLIAVAGFGVINIILFYFIGNILEKESEVKQMQRKQEYAQNQMNLYRSMHENYERQKQYMHDYKNQLQCIQGLLAEKKTEEALRYTEHLTGSLAQRVNAVNTNHHVVNVVLNQKYQYAKERGINMVMGINDLSTLTMEEVDIVTLLVNLIDNAIEACEKLTENRVIQFKMMVEEEQLILSTGNPVHENVLISGKTIATSKQNFTEHGIGLQRVEEVVKKYDGTSVLQCRDGWFLFSAVFPINPKEA